MSADPSFPLPEQELLGVVEDIVAAEASRVTREKNDADEAEQRASIEQLFRQPNQTRGQVDYRQEGMEHLAAQNEEQRHRNRVKLGVGEISVGAFMMMTATSWQDYVGPSFGATAVNVAGWLTVFTGFNTVFSRFRKKAS